MQNRTPSIYMRIQNLPSRMQKTLYANRRRLYLAEAL
jgi:hypothetical protein